MASRPWAAELRSVSKRPQPLCTLLHNVRPGVEAAKLDHLAKLVEALHRILNLGEFQTDSIGLVGHLEQREADGALEEQEIDHHHLD